MPLEVSDTIAGLNASWPLGSDPKSQGDDHLRLIKDVMQKDALPLSGGTMTGALRVGAGDHYVSILDGSGAKRVTVQDDSGADPETMSMDTDGGEGRLYWQSGGNPVNTMNFQADGSIRVPGNITSPASIISIGGNLGAPFSIDDTNCFIAAQTATPTLSGAFFFETNWTENITIGARHNPGVEADMLLTVGPSATFILRNNGEAFAPLRWTDLSDAAIKDNLLPITGALEKLSALKGWTYNRTDLEDTSTRHAGIIAQDVQGVLPEAVSTHSNGLLGVSAGAMVALLVQAVHELTARIEELEDDDD